MTKLDEAFVAAGIAIHPEAAYYINTLAEEVRRLEALGGGLEDALQQAIDRLEAGYTPSPLDGDAALLRKLKAARAGVTSGVANKGD